MSSINEKELLLQMAGGSYASFTVLYNHYIQRLIWYGMRFTGDQVLVEDALHETFTWLWHHRATLPIHTSLKAYLFTSVRQNLLARLARQRRTTTIDEGKEDVVHFELQLSPENELVRKEENLLRQQRMRTLIRQLTPRQQEIIYMRYYEDLSFEEIAAALQLSVKASYKLMGRAIAALRELVDATGTWMTVLLTVYFYYFLKPMG